MKTIWWKVSNFRSELFPINVVKETEKSIVIREDLGPRFNNPTGPHLFREHRALKSSHYENFFKTIDEAYEFSKNKYINKIKSLENQHCSERAELEKLEKQYNDFKLLRK